MDFQDLTECERAIARIQTILDSEILEAPRRADPLVESAFVDLLICLRDLLFKAQKFAGYRASFTDDVWLNSQVKDVHDAVVELRDSACHVNSFKHKITGASTCRGVFNRAYGNTPLMVVDGVSLGSAFDDESAFFYGANGLYLKRHIVRAFEEARSALQPVMTPDPP